MKNGTFALAFDRSQSSLAMLKSLQTGGGVVGERLQGVGVNQWLLETAPYMVVFGRYGRTGGRTLICYNQDEFKDFAVPHVGGLMLSSGQGANFGVHMAGELGEWAIEQWSAAGFSPMETKLVEVAA